MILKKNHLFLILIIQWIGSCLGQSLPAIPFSDLVEGDSVFISGGKLIASPSGLNLIQFPDSRSDTVFIAVHGYGSRGYEWVHPLKLMAASGQETFFYRWDWNDCPREATDRLEKAIQQLLVQQPEIRHFIIFGHSYGGVIVALLARELHDSISVALNSVAAPLGGHIRLAARCPDFPDFKDVDGSGLTQWRTRKEQDGAFRDLPLDPQVVDLAQSQVILLPDSINGVRLGHNRSISWVLDQYFNDRPEKSTE
ncbi:MAG: esterase/lipase family protein [Fidelibacterota bacterium]